MVHRFRSHTVIGNGFTDNTDNATENVKDNLTGKELSVLKLALENNF